MSDRAGWQHCNDATYVDLRTSSGRNIVIIHHWERMLRRHLRFLEIHCTRSGRPRGRKVHLTRSSVSFEGWSLVRDRTNRKHCPSHEIWSYKRDGRWWGWSFVRGSTVSGENAIWGLFCWYPGKCLLRSTLVTILLATISYLSLRWLERRARSGSRRDCVRGPIVTGFVRDGWVASWTGTAASIYARLYGQQATCL